MRDEIIAATDRALRQVGEPRFLRTERGFQGRFYCALQRVLEEDGLLRDGRILEMEYQKSRRHALYQRPDIVFHVPAEDSGAEVTQNNFAVWALKRHATPLEAIEDFAKLDEMFATLYYSLGIFINIDENRNFADAYPGKFGDRLRAVAVWLDEKIVTRWGRPGTAPSDS